MLIPSNWIWWKSKFINVIIWEYVYILGKIILRILLRIRTWLILLNPRHIYYISCFNIRSHIASLGGRLFFNFIVRYDKLIDVHINFYFTSIREERYSPSRSNVATFTVGSQVGLFELVLPIWCTLPHLTWRASLFSSKVFTLIIVRRVCI
jgi:hypothetical protein